MLLDGFEVSCQQFTGAIGSPQLSPTPPSNLAGLLTGMHACARACVRECMHAREPNPDPTQANPTQPHPTQTQSDPTQANPS